MSNVISSKVQFDPYADNGGTIVGIAGNTFVLLAADTRLSHQYAIQSRTISRLFEIDKQMILSASGCWADVYALYKLLLYNCEMYKVQNGVNVCPSSLASLLAHTLYLRRIKSPIYYSSCIVGGLDNFGRSRLWKYDYAGSYQSVSATCAGKGETMIQPLLDEISRVEEDNNLWEFCENVSQDTVGGYLNITEDAACKLALDVFKAAAERHITIGDSVEILIVKRDRSSEKEDFNSRSIPKIRRFVVPLSRH